MMKDAAPQKPANVDTNYRSLLISMFLAASFVIGSMVYVMQMNNHITKEHVNLTEAAEHILLDASQAYLLLEESLAGGSSINNQTSFEALFHRIRANFDKLKHTSHHAHFFLAHEKIKEIPSLHQHTLTDFNAIEKRTYERLAHPTDSKIGSVADQEYDKLAHALNTRMNQVARILRDSTNYHLNHLKNTEIIAFFLSLLILVSVAALISTFFKRQKKHFEQLLEHRVQNNVMEDKYRILIEQSPFSIQIMSPDGTLLQVNRAWEELWHTTRHALGDYNLLQDPFIQKSDIYEDIKKGFLGEPVDTVVTNFNPSATENKTSPFTNRFVRTHIYPIRDKDAKIEQIVVIFSDVTTSYLQHAFQLGQNKVLELISHPSSTLQDVLRELILFVEKQAPDMIGSILLLDETNTRAFDAAGPNLPTAYRHAINGLEIGPKVGSCGTAAYTGERVIVSDINSDPLWEDFKDLALSFDLKACWSQPIKDSHGKVLGTFAMYYEYTREPNEEDITLIENVASLASNAIVHKKSLEQVILSEASMAEAQRLSHIGSWELNLKDDSLIWSDEIYRIFELDKDEFKPSYAAFLALIHPDDKSSVEDAYNQSLATKQPYEITHRLLMPDGRIKHVIERCNNFFDAEGKALLSVGSVQDITPLVHAQKEKDDVQAKMEHVQRLESLGVLAGGIAHDFNNILTTILGNAGLASHKLPDSSPVNDYIERITQASQKAADLCKQMLAYSGKGNFIVKPVLLSELVEEMTQLLQVSIAKSIVLRFDLHKQTPVIDADVTQMQQIIMNLVINASEAIGENSGAISISTGIVRLDKQYLSTTFIDESLEEGAYVYLEVSDTGCGMNEEVKEKLFEPFFTTKFTGRGLGMAAILGIIRGHHGAIKVYSEEGKGSTFKILFPFSQQTPVPLQQNNSPATHWFGKGNILIVDDEETIREVAVTMLGDMGIQSLTAADGIEAVALFKEHHETISAVLLDMTMPRMGGEDTFTELCRIEPNVKVILSSGYTEQDATHRFAGKGLAGFLQKPYTPAELAKKLSLIFNKT